MLGILEAETDDWDCDDLATALLDGHVHGAEERSGQKSKSKSKMESKSVSGGYRARRAGLGLQECERG